MTTPTPDTSRKHALLETLRKQLQEELEASRRHALDSAEAVVHEDNRPENEKDMRSTEASYVARGLAARAQELESAIARLAGMTLRNFAPEDEIAVSALVDLRQGRRTTTYFLVPAGGGMRLSAGSQDILALATTSPLGEALLGMHEGDEAELTAPQGTRVFDIVKVR